MSNILLFPEPNDRLRELYKHENVDFRIRFDEDKNLHVEDNGTDPMVTMAMIATATGAFIMKNFKTEQERRAALIATFETCWKMLDIGEDGIRE